jgi:hypothetical protein
MAEPAAEEMAVERRIGVGCITAFAGFFSGGMIGVFVAKVVGSMRGCKPPEGLPACDWHVFAAVGMLIGVVSLPVLAMRRLRRGGAGENSKRGF